jgi:hypothetical protein
MESKLKECPFCGSTDIDPEGVASFRDEEKHNPDGSLRNWKDDALPERIQHSPACNECGATTDGDWNTRHTSPLEADVDPNLPLVA